jgi:hypothetical protein
MFEVIENEHLCCIENYSLSLYELELRAYIDIECIVKPLCDTRQPNTVFELY